MTDVMNYNEQKVKLPSIKELTIGLPQAPQQESAAPPPKERALSQPQSQPQPQPQSQITLPRFQDHTHHGSYSSESSNSRQSSVSSLHQQYPAVPLVLGPHSPARHFRSVTQPQPPHPSIPPQYVHQIPRDAIMAPQQVIHPQHLQVHQQSVYPQSYPHPHDQQLLRAPQTTMVYQLPHSIALPPHSSSLEYQSRHGQPRKKRPRRKANEMVRLYACNYKACRNSYGTLNHLNAHITFKRHGPKRKPEEFKQIRELYKLQKNLSEKKKVAGDNGDLKTEENIKILANLSENLIDSETPVFHQQRGYNGYGRLDHTVKKGELAEQLPGVLGER